MNDLAEAPGLSPEVVSIDCSMSEPERAMMRVVMFLVGSCLHRPIPGQRRFSRPDQWIVIRPRHVLEKVLGEKMAVDFNPKPVRELRDLHALAGRRTGSLPGGKRSANMSQKQQANSGLYDSWHAPEFANGSFEGQQQTRCVQLAPGRGIESRLQPVRRGFTCLTHFARKYPG